MTTDTPLSLRRGLPRTPGGDPWPPAVASAATSTVAASTKPEYDDAAPALQISLRQGLPRVVGGPAWPPLDATATSTPVVPAPAEPVEVKQEVSQPVVAEPAVDEPVFAEPAVAKPLVSEPVVAEPAVAQASVAAPVVAPPVVSPATPQVESRTQAASSSSPVKKAEANPKPAGKPEPKQAEPKRYGAYTLRQWIGTIAAVIVGLQILALVVVLVARGLMQIDAVQNFVQTYPGHSELPESAPVGVPAWLAWQHFLNMFLMVLIIRSGLQVRRETKPAAYWTPKGSSKKVSLTIWLHQALDVLWLVNGLIFVILLFATGQWMKIVPTSWDVFPNAISAGLQYATLYWPTENGWVHYNGLQQLTYFVTVFIAAPLAAITGFRMSTLWPEKNKTLAKLYPAEIARKLHFPVMIYFVAFIVVHVALVFATGALRNLNHMFAARGSVDAAALAGDWTGFWFFVGSMVIIAGAWIVARPSVVAPIARLFGKVSSR